MKWEIVLKIGAIICILIFKNIVGYGQVQTYSIVGTGQTISYDTMHAITMPIQLDKETSKFPSGIYTVNFVNENEVINHKFIKE